MSRNVNTFRIFDYLMENEETEQASIANILNLSPRTIIREIKFLEAVGVIKFVRKRSSDRGRPGNFWAPTLNGLLYYFHAFLHNYTSTPDVPFPTRVLERIYQHPDKALIFKYWDFLNYDVESKRFVSFALIRYIKRKMDFGSLISLRKFDFSNFIEIRQSEDEWNELKQNYLYEGEEHERELLYHCLGLHHLFEDKYLITVSLDWLTSVFIPKWKQNKELSESIEPLIQEKFDLYQERYGIYFDIKN